MHVIQYSHRIYFSLFLCLCAAFLFAPSVANANQYWSVLEKRWIPADQTPNAVKEMLGHKVSRPSGSTLSAVPSSPSISKNATGGLSASTNNILKTLDQPSNFSATSNWSAASAKNALKSCVRSPACAGRALGAGAVIYEGIRAWKEVYELVVDPQTNQILQPETFNNRNEFSAQPYQGSAIERPAVFLQWPINTVDGCNHKLSSNYVFAQCWISGSPPYEYVEGFQCNVSSGSPYHYPFVGLSGNICQYANDEPWEREIPYAPVSLSELDTMIDDTYSPAVSDAPVVLLSGEPDTFSLTTPEPAQLPSTTTTNTDSNNQTITTVKNAVITYNILNNNSSSPSIESVITETSNTYDDTANLVGSMTSTTTNNAVAPDPMPPSSSGASADIEIPPFCTWAKVVCDWIGWTQEELGEEEPDLSQLITVFEPDEEGYDVGIGSGSCPAPMLLNLGIINKTVEVKYDPFCSFLEMIKPFVLAAAYLFAAYLYIGVLKRG